MSRGRFEQQKEKPKKSKIVLIVIAVILVLVAAVAVAGVIYYNSMLNKIKHVEVPKIQYTTAPTVAETTEAVETTETTTEATEPHIPSPEDYINILLVGQAARAGEEERHADTMIVVTVNKYEKTISMTSVLRDTVVQRGNSFKGHTYGGGKINAMYHMGYTWDGVAGSMAVMNQILYDNFGIEIDHNFEVDFDAFMEIVNLLGGIEVEINEAEAKYLNDEDFWVYEDVEPGLVKMNGMVALTYARMRKAEGDSDSDIVRTERQRKVITAVLDKVQTKSLTRLQKMADKVLPYITTSMTNSEITDLMFTMLPMVADLKIVNSGTCPAAGTYKGDVADIYKNGYMQSILRFDEQQNKKIMRSITEGEAY